jgi:phospholipase C
VLQRQEGKAWKVVASRSLSARSHFSVQLRFPKAGRFIFRAALLPDARHLWSHSAPLKLDITEIHKIKHVVIIMQENRSFDHYFGTFPGAQGIPGVAGNPGQVPCVPDPLNGGCDKPFHDTSDVNYGGPHSTQDSDQDMDCADQTQ